MTRLEVRIGGLGGQGVVFAGQILGRAAVYDGMYAIQTQSYGAEARGSAARSDVMIADHKVWFPIVRKCDILVVMNQSSLNEHLSHLKGDGTLLVDEHMVQEVPQNRTNVFRVPATRVAETELKSKVYANVILLGALVRIAEVVSVKATEKAIVDLVPQESLEKNLAAFKRGLELRG